MVPSLNPKVTMSQIYDLVRVVNTGSTELVLRGNTRYTIAAGEERIIPFNEAAAWFGDPRLQDDGRNRFRSEAFRMTQNLWGFTEGMKYMRDRWDPSQGFLEWEDFKPSVDCFDMEGNPMWFLIHDPDGAMGSGNAPALIDPSTLDAAALVKQVQQMADQMAKLQDALRNRAEFDAQTPRPSDRPGPTATPLPATTMLAEEFNNPVVADEPNIADAVVFPQPAADDKVTDDAPRTVRSRSK